MSKEKFLTFLLWGLVAYTLGILICFTLKSFEYGTEFISALGSILSAIATFFAAFVAIYLYIDWRKPHKANFYAEYCKKILESYFKIRLLQQKLKVVECKIKEIIINKDTNKKINPNFLSSHLKKNLTDLNSEIDSIISDIYMELDCIFENTNTLASLTENLSILELDISIRSHLYDLYRPIREYNPPNQPYYKYNNLLTINKDKFLIIKQQEFLSEIKEVGGLI